jgi:hypothetical protein
MPMDFIVPHGQETHDDSNPVYVVRYDGSVGGRVLPAEDGIEDTPSAASIEFWIAKLVEKVSDNKRRSRGRDRR